MLENFLKFVEDNQLLTTDEKILLSVSGGRDSTALCKLFSEAGRTFAIAHCNYHLRGEESNRDEMFVRNLAEKYHVKIHVANFDTQKHASDNKLSIEMAARNLRYQWYDSLINEEDYIKIATAHHLNDQTETFFINILRTTGMYGIKGIPVIRNVVSTQGKEYSIIRPLLFATRKDIDNYMQNDEFVDDNTNFTDKYVRNYIRLNIIPEFENLKQNFPKVLDNSIRQFNNTIALVQRVLKDNFNVEHDDNGNVIIPLPENYSTSEMAGYLYFMLYEYNFNLDRIQNMAQKTNAVGSKFFSHDFVVFIDRNKLIISRKDKLKEKDFFLKIDDFDKRMIVDMDESQHLLLEKKRRAEVKVLNQGENIAFIDCNKLTFPLIVNNLHTGDYFFPLGMNKKKKVADFLTDVKIDSFSKRNILIVRSKDDIVWIMDHRIDNRFKIDDTTDEILMIQHVVDC